MNKKAQTLLGPSKTVFYMVFGGFVVTMMLILLIVFTNSQKEIAIHPDNLQLNLVKYRVTNSDCFTSKQFTRAIDWDKFNQVTMDSCIISDIEDSIHYRLTLTDKESKKEIQTKHFISSSKSIITEYPVLKNNKIIPGELKIEIS